MSLVNPFQIHQVARAGPRTPQVKACEKSQRFEVHTTHPWEKKPGFPLLCEGILPVDEQPPCQFYISPEKPRCGEPAPVSVRVKTATVDAKVDLCIFHKHRHDNSAATRRAAHADQARAS